MIWMPPETKRKWDLLTEDERWDLVFILIGIVLVIAGFSIAFGLPAFLVCVGVLFLAVGMVGALK